MMWRIALIDSGAGAHATAQGRFDPAGLGPFATSADPTGHGSRLAQLLHEFARPHELILGQVFGESTPTTVAAISSAIAWAVQQKAHLIHLSLGLQADRPALADVVKGAVEAGTLVPTPQAIFPRYVETEGDLTN
jgi:hypothetical protein